jgi:hypothetical protein
MVSSVCVGGGLFLGAKAPLGHAEIVNIKYLSASVTPPTPPHDIPNAKYVSASVPPLFKKKRLVREIL